jgi:tol-pal system protein YbgF
VGLTPGESAETGGDPTAQAQESVSEETAPQGLVPGFGTTTVEPPEDTGETRDWASLPDSSEAEGAGDPEAQALFTQAYDALLAQDYAAAREGFETFIEAHPDDPLVNNARYWLADAAFAEGDYVAAANNFVKVYNTAPRGEKSEETLLKLAVTLRRMDRSKAACDALSRLDGRLDGKPEAFRERVENERSRSGCS